MDSAFFCTFYKKKCIGRRTQKKLTAIQITVSFYKIPTDDASMSWLVYSLQGGAFLCVSVKALDALLAFSFLFPQ